MKNCILLLKSCTLIIGILFSINLFSQTTIYSEGFTSGAGGWTVSSTGSGTGAWLNGTDASHSTGATGNYFYSQKYTTNYNNGTFIIATSPTINTTGFTNITFDFNIWYRTESAWDGMQVEYSLNNGSSWADLGSVGASWYNDNDVDGINDNAPGWSGNSSGWISRNMNLSSFNIGFNGNSQVKFRIILGSDGSVTDIGVGFDEILVRGTSTTPTPEINIQGNATNIPDGDTSPTTADHTDFGNVAVASNFSRTFTIQNLGSANLNLTGASPRIAISGANAADFSVTTIPSTPIAASGSTTFVIRFAPTTAGIKNATLTIANNDSDENPYDFSITGTGVAPAPEINIQGNATTIPDNDTTPSITDFTDFGSVGVTAGSVTNNFVIQNIGTANLNLTGASPYIIISGAHASDFAVTTTPSATIATGNSTIFSIAFDPSSAGLRTATITIANNDSDENPYNFNIQGTGIYGPPQYTAYYETFDINNGGWNPVTSTNDTWVWSNTYPASVTNAIAEGGFWRNNTYNNYANNTDIVVESPVYNFTNLQNLRLSLDVEYNTENNTDGMRILYSISGGAYTVLGASGSGTNWYDDNTSALGSDGWNDDSHPTSPVFSGPYSHFKNARLNLADGVFSNQSNVRFRIQFASNGANTDVGVGFDNFRIEADPLTTLSNASVAPADVKANLRLWLKANSGIAVTDGTKLTTWEDQAYANALDKEDATAASYIAPTYRNNVTRNINFNPVADFNNSNTEYMNGKGGFFSQDYFVVVKSNDIVNTNTGTTGRQFPLGGRSDDANYHEDPTGVAFGNSTGRYINQVIAHNIGAYANSGFTPGINSYGRA